MPSTGTLTLKATVSGFPFSSASSGSVGYLNATFSNSSAMNRYRRVTLSQSQASKPDLSALSSALFALVVMNSTYRDNYRLTGSTAEVGILLHSRFPAVFGHNSSLIHIYTTSGSTGSLNMWIA